jgi:transposase
LRKKLIPTASILYTPQGFAWLQRDNQSLRYRVATLELSEQRKTTQVKYHLLEVVRCHKEMDGLQRKYELLSLDLFKEQEHGRGQRAKLTSAAQQIVALKEAQQKKDEKKDLQIADLTEQLRIARLPKNSSNSSRPPSTDLYKPLRNTNNSLRQKSGKKSGGQPGHAGSTLLFNQRVPDATVRHSADYCEACGIDISRLDTVTEEIRQVIDIPSPKYVITNHITYKKVCSCGHCNHGCFPANVKSAVSYGPGTQALVVNLSTRQYLPYDRLSKLIGDLYGIAMSEGTIANILARFEQKASTVYEHIRQQIFKSEVVGSDETSANVNGQNHWFHTYQNPLWTFIGYHQSRGINARDAFYPSGLPNTILVTDCLAMQLTTPAKEHQVCLDHLLRELNAMEQEYPRRHWPVQMKALIKNALDLKKKEYTLLQVRQIERKFRKLLKIDQSNAPGKIAAFWKRMIKHADKVFTFLQHENVPPDNNGSERAIRNVKVKQKVSGQFKAQKGARQYAVCRSIIDTAGKQGKNIHDVLAKIANLVPG